MALTKIAVGTSANDGTGDPLRTAFQRVNNAFDQIDANTLAIAGALMKSALGTGVETALGIAIGSVGAAIINGGVLGTPSSGTLTSCTGLPAAGVVGTAAILGANTFTGRQILSVAGAASTPAQSLTGSIFTGGSATTTKPQFLIEPTGTTSTGWSTTGTLIGANASSGFVGMLCDFQVAGASKFKADYLGNLYLANGGGLSTFSGGSLTLGINQFSSGAHLTITNINVGFGSARTLFYDSNAYLSGGYQVQFANSRADASDCGLRWGAAGTLKVTNGSTGYAAIDASAFKVSGTTGASFGPGLPTSITVVNGIITAIS